MIKWLFRFFAKLFGIPSFWLLLRPRYYLEDKKRKTRSIHGPAIIVSNHLHIMDYFTLLFAHPFRKQRFLVSEAIYQHPFLGFLSKMMDNILVHRERSDLSFMAEAEKTLKKNGVVTIFPEGHLVKDGKLDTFKPAAIYLALRTGAPIIPHYIEPNYFKFKRARIVVGEPINIRDYCSSDNPSIGEVRQLCEMLRTRTNELKRKLSLYRRYHTKDIVNPRAWFLDLAKAFLWLPTFFVFPTTFHYAEGASKNDRRIKGRGLIVSKHFGFVDPPILDMHYFSRRIHIIVAKELYDTNPWLLKHLFTIKYDRIANTSDPKCFLEVINYLKADGVVGIYPEGHISRESILEFHEGAAYFALTTNSPIYIYYMLKPYKPFHHNHVMIGKTIYPHQLFSKEELKNKETITKLTAIIKERYFALKNDGEKYLKKTKNKQKID
jgi:1-acyl-sn-glycerol-3-phosphate acyltransferase